MSNFTVVTSFSRKGWDEYGQRFVTTFNEFWPKEIELFIVSEDEFETCQNNDRKVTNWSLNDYPKAKAFYGQYKELLWAHGDSGSTRPDWTLQHWKQRGGYCFRHDAYKFSKKIFAIDMVRDRIAPKRLCWIDADVITFAPVPIEIIEQVLPINYAISYLPRALNYHSECGFVGYNLCDLEARKFISRFADLYVTGEVFGLAEWHDSWVFDWLRKDMKINGFPIPHGSNHHPFINSVLGNYMDHLKGSRKAKGRSHPSEQLKNQTVGYWRKR